MKNEMNAAIIFSSVENLLYILWKEKRYEYRYELNCNIVSSFTPSTEVHFVPRRRYFSCILLPYAPNLNNKCCVTEFARMEPLKASFLLIRYLRLI